MTGFAPLQARLEAIRADFESKAPAEALEVMRRSTQDLIESGLHEKALAEGSSFPEFELIDTQGETVSSEDLLDGEPAIINFFRGFW